MSHKGERSDDNGAKASIIEALSSDQSRFMVCESGIPSQSHGFRAPKLPYGRYVRKRKTAFLEKKVEQWFCGRKDGVWCVTGGGSFDVNFGRVLQLRAVFLQSIADLIARHGAILFHGDRELRMCHFHVPDSSDESKFGSFNAGQSGSSHKYLSPIFFPFFQNCEFFLLRYCKKKRVKTKNEYPSSMLKVV